MNKEDILLLVDYFTESGTLGIEKMDKLISKLKLIKKQIEAQDVIADVQKELAEMDRVVTECPLVEDK